jgi:hypothetical protein
LNGFGYENRLIIVDLLSVACSKTHRFLIIFAISDLYNVEYEDITALSTIVVHRQYTARGLWGAYGATKSYTRG